MRTLLEITQRNVGWAVHAISSFTTLAMRRLQILTFHPCKGTTHDYICFHFWWLPREDLSICHIVHLPFPHRDICHNKNYRCNRLHHSLYNCYIFNYVRVLAQFVINLTKLPYTAKMIACFAMANTTMEPSELYLNLQCCPSITFQQLGYKYRFVFSTAHTRTAA